MLTIIDDTQETYSETHTTDLAPKENDALEERSINNAITHFNPTTQLLLSSKLITHSPESGLNPLVDAAAYLFSVMGKLKHIKSYRNLSKLHDELIQEIESFQECAKAYHHSSQYISEYLPVACYALCVTIDDIIINTPWGNQGQWDRFNLLTTFNQSSISREGFFIILERLVRDPDQYIDVMEFMYICLSLGFKGHYNHSAFDRDQLDLITNSLYKRIRACRGDFSKTLSPFLIKPRAAPQKPATEKRPKWLIASIAASCAIIAIITGTYLLDRNATQTHSNLIQTDKAVTYEIHNKSHQ